MCTDASIIYCSSGDWRSRRGVAYSAESDYIGKYDVRVVKSR